MSVFTRSQQHVKLTTKSHPQNYGYLTAMSRTVLSSMCRRCQKHLPSTQHRLISTSSISSAPRQGSAPRPVARSAQGAGSPARQGLERAAPSAKIVELSDQAANEAQTRPQAGVASDEPYHLNVYCTKNNMHLTFTEPSRDPILSFSTGNMGLKGAQRKQFDAAYQLASYTFRKIAEKQWRLGGKKSSGATIMLSHESVHRRGIEVILRGYGFGREAFQKAILGQEGRMIKTYIKRVTDGTRLKFGGARSPAVRRLG